MRDDERCARHKTAVDLAQRLQALVAGNEMKCQQAGRTFERPCRGGVDVTLVKTDSRRVPSRDLFRHAEHVGRRVDAYKRPAGMIVGERLQLQPATGSQHQNPPLRGDALGQQHRGHPVKTGKARNLPGRPLGIGARMGRVEGGRIGAGIASHIVISRHGPLTGEEGIPMSSRPAVKQRRHRPMTRNRHMSFTREG